jgi:signal peptidase I
MLKRFIKRGPKPEAAIAAPKRFEGVKSFLSAVALALLFRSFLYEPFHIPSGSMLSTLYEGDYIFVSKFSYGYTHFSFPMSIRFFDGRIWSDAPERGDIAVFRLPTNPSIDYIKRVVGLPGDTIRVVDGVLHINGRPVDLKRIADTQFPDDEGNVRSVATYSETLPNGRKHIVLDETKLGDVDFTDEYEVPKGHYFVMGDNRDNSVDSRYQNEVGFVPAENLIGRAEVIAFSYNTSVAIWDIANWPELFREGRFWKELH